MSTKSIPAEEARNNLRTLLDDVVAGHEVVIERYNKPVGVLVPHAHWQAWKRHRREQLQRIRQEMDAGNYVTQEELEAGLRERGML
jgi:prevent-host-death family protein